MKTLADMEARVNADARNILSHTIKYNGRDLRVQGSYEDGTINSIGSVGIKQDIELMILKEDLPTMPVSSDRILLPRIPGKIWKPANVQNDERATHWLLNVVQVAV